VEVEGGGGLIIILRCLFVFFIIIPRFFLCDFSIDELIIDFFDSYFLSV
jgi:hypothetical protein